VNKTDPTQINAAAVDALVAAAVSGTDRWTAQDLLAPLLPNLRGIERWVHWNRIMSAHGLGADAPEWLHPVYAANLRAVCAKAVECDADAARLADYERAVR
jgi:hypothetical protein